MPADSKQSSERGDMARELQARALRARLHAAYISDDKAAKALRVLADELEARAAAIGTGEAGPRL